MQLLRLRPLAALCAALAFALPPGTSAAGDYRLSEPVVHDNLAIYFVRSAASSGATPLTLQEAIGAGAVKVHETGSVNELSIENIGKQEVFVQAGDIVKGGQQDRVLSVSLLLQPQSGRIPIASFCVEAGRWAQRGKEDVRMFSSASSSLPSRKAKMAMRPHLAEPNVRPGQPAARPADPGTGQQAMWDQVKAMQSNLSRSVGTAAASPASPTSLQLTLENDKLKAAQASYVTALKPAGEADADIVGYVFAINGKINSADIYPSNGLFRKMWEKLVNANATEAIGEKDSTAAPPPSVDAVRAFLAAAEAGQQQDKPLTKTVSLQIRDSEAALYSETRRADGTWVYRNYLAK